MASIVFVQRLWYEYPGTAILSSFLKKNGHTVRVIIGESSKEIIGKLSEGEVVAFSIMTGMHHWALKVANDIKGSLKSLTVFGGAHPTYFPDIIQERGVDVICRGEGEHALLELADAVDSNSDITGIKNLWIKRDGVVYKNPLRPLIEDLDSLPFQDREIYYHDYPFLKNNSHKIFIAGRGCPFECTFCFNERLKDMYKNNGRFVRFRSPQDVIEEIKEVRDRYGIETVFFHDDIFVLNHKWLREFLNRYREDVSIPFYCAARADTLREDTVKLLSQGGCKCISFAIESGNEEIRNEVLGKRITNQQIIESARLLKKYGIKLTTFNMLGIPGETIKDAFETVNLNIKIGTDYPRCSFLTPYPGTKIAEYAAQYGYMESTINTIVASSQQSDSIIKMADRNRMINLHLFFQTAILFPIFLPFIKYLIKLPPNVIFRIWWSLVYFFVFTVGEGRKIKEMFIFTVKSFRSLYGREQGITNS
jgi:radical SAM superfamily enzyme YgiQ (UPF0313 family)